MVTEKQLANLRPAQKGEVRNPFGKPKGVRSAKIILRELLQTETDFTDESGTRKILTEEAIWLRTIADAIKGDAKARRDIYDRLEGKPVAHVEFDDGSGDFPVKVIAVEGFLGWNK